MARIKGMAVEIRPNEREAILQKIGQILDRGWLMVGPCQDELEAKFAALCGRKHAVLFNSATAGLEILYEQLGAAAAGVACFQANNFPSPVFAARRKRYAAVFADIDPIAICPVVGDLEQEYARNPFQVLTITWTGGYIGDAVEVRDWCKAKDVFLVEDASHAAGSRTADGKIAGSFGDVGVFSLASTKPLHTGYGGVLVCDDDRLAQQMRYAKNYGRTAYFHKGEYVNEGYNANMTEMQAAVGLVLMENMQSRIDERRAMARIYDECCREAGCTVLGRPGNPNFYKYVVRLPEGVNRDVIEKAMAFDDIELGSTLYNFLCPELAVFKMKPQAVDLWPKARAFSASHVCLPMHNALSMEDVSTVGDALIKVLRDA